MKKIIIKKTIPILLLIILAVAGGSFYAGMKYGQGKSAFGSNMQNISSQQREQFLQARSARRMGANFLFGEVIAKDEQTITIKTPDGSSRIVVFSLSTKVLQTTEGSIKDIEIGKQIMVNASQNPDSTYSAKTIQISGSLTQP